MRNIRRYLCINGGLSTAWRVIHIRVEQGAFVGLAGAVCIVQYGC